MFRPLNKNILLQFVKNNNSVQNLFLGDSQRKVYEVISVGKEVVEIKVSDHVYLDETKLVSLNIQGNDYYLIEEQYIYLVVED